MPPFCKYLTNQHRYEYDDFSPCCWITRKCNINNAGDLTQYKEWVATITDWVPECSFCKDREERNIRSPRLMSFSNPNWGELENSSDIVSLELQLDKDCNSACLICRPKYSTTWQKYNNKIHNIKITNAQIDKHDMRAADARIKLITNTVAFDKIKKIAFLGGEPLKSNTHLTIIKEVKKVKELTDVNLTYITNGSIKPSNEVIDVWSTCNKVNVNVSMDGIGEHFNYLRWPLQWHQVINNIRYMLDLKLPNFSMSFSYAVTPFSIFYHNTYENWAREFFKENDNIVQRPFGNPFEAVGTINLQCIPPSLVEEIIVKYQNIDTFTKNGASLTKGQNISQLILPFDSDAYTTFMNYVTLHDTHRNLNWRKVFPEIEHHFTESGKNATLSYSS